MNWRALFSPKSMKAPSLKAPALKAPSLKAPALKRSSWKRPGWKLPFRLPRRSVLVGVTAVLWIALFLGGAMPTWKKTRRNEEKITAVSFRLATLNQWSVAGVWLAEEVRRWEPVQQEVYQRLFPYSKQREDLFLDLVRVANACGIDPIRIMEAPHAFRPGTEDWDEGYYYEDDEGDDAMETDMLINEFTPDLSNLPETRLTAHRAMMTFEAEYSELASYLEALETVPRALSIHRLTCTPMNKGVEVRMELDFYVQKSD